MLRDFLFIDEKIIDRLFEQISGPNKSEQTTSFKALLSFPKIGIETEIKSEKRPYTLTEKIQIVEEHLECNDNAGIYRKFNLLEKAQFEENHYPFDIAYIKFLNFDAVKILIADGKNTEMIMWVSADPEIRIYLFEQMRNIDGAPLWWSSFSTFNAIIDELDQNQGNTLTNKLRESGFDGFDDNPGFYLTQIAKMKSAPRLLNCMIKVRTTFMPRKPDGSRSKGVLGYPIYIY